MEDPSSIIDLSDLHAQLNTHRHSNNFALIQRDKFPPDNNSLQDSATEFFTTTTGRQQQQQQHQQTFIGFNFSTAAAANIGGNNDNQEENSEEDSEKEEREEEEEEENEYGDIPTSPPGGDEIEQRLGPITADDQWCYLHDGVNLYDAANLSDETRKIRDDISAGAQTYNDLVVLSKQIQEDYNKTIWNPEQAAAKSAKRKPSDNLRPWTLRSIYNHIRRGDISRHTLVMNAVRDLSDLASDIRNHGLYVRNKKSKSRKTVSHFKCVMYLKVMQRLGQMAKLSLDIESEQLRQATKGKTTTSGNMHAGASFTSISAINNKAAATATTASSSSSSAAATFYSKSDNTDSISVTKPFPRVWN